MSRGINVIVTTVLLIIIGVTTATLIYMWMSGYVTRELSILRLSPTQEITIIGVNVVNDTTSTVKVYVLNSGEVKVTISSVYILDTYGNVIDDCVKLNANIDVNIGEVNYVEVQCSIALSSGTYIAKVITTTGIEDEKYFTI